MIGLVDGRYEDIAAVWHKEILYAIEQGALVFGAASMGALRAAECADFGMIGVGAVFERYRSGELDRRCRRRPAACAGGVGLPAAHRGAGQCRGDDPAVREAQGHVGGGGGSRSTRRAGAVLQGADLSADPRARRARQGERGKQLARADKTLPRRPEAGGCADALRTISRPSSRSGRRRPEWRLHTTYTWNLTLARAAKACVPGRRQDRGRLADALEGHRHALPHADAHRGEGIAPAAALKLAHGGAGDPRA